MKLSFERLWTDDDGMLEIAVTASNGSQTTTMDVYIHPETLVEFGEQLAKFPRSPAHEVILESGGREPDWYGHFRVRAFVLSPSKATIEVSTLVRGEPPQGSEAHFYIATEAAGLNRFGRAIRSWAKSDELHLRFPSQSQD